MKWKNNLKKKQVFILCLLLFLCLVSMVFVTNNYGVYDRPIAKVVHMEVTHSEAEIDMNGNKDRLYTQKLIGELKNGNQKGKKIELTNSYTKSKAYDQAYKTGDELFITIDKSKGKTLKGTIQDVKRDKYMMAGFWAFLIVLYGIGKKQGLFAVFSLAVNIALLAGALEIYVRTGQNLLLLSGLLVILFTVLSLLVINGPNQKTYAAILTTLLGTFASIGITLLVMRLTSENGLRYEEMQFLTRPYKTVFIAGLFIGALGAVMDVAITITSSIFELWEKNHDITIQALKKSGLEIGRDIMGTMTSILFFAYISGSIPMLILYLKNALPLGYTLSVNLSLELTRALAGGIGIVLAIPIGLYISIFFIKRKRTNI